MISSRLFFYLKKKVNERIFYRMQNIFRIVTNKKERKKEKYLNTYPLNRPLLL